ncbi:hypothetical protein A2U01_0087257, partial [Trifolium medium]|nr:hypothetical protein [Trifolium medium]
KGKEPIVSGATAADASKKKRADKEKIEEVVKEKELLFLNLTKLSRSLELRREKSKRL